MIAVVVVFISNPITMPPLFFTAYKVGAHLLGETPRAIDFEISIDWLLTSLVEIWQPFLLGCLTMSVLSAMVGYLAVQIIWRIHVRQLWRERQRYRSDRPEPLRGQPRAAKLDDEIKMKPRTGSDG